MDDFLIPAPGADTCLRLHASTREPSGALSHVRAELVAPSLHAAASVYVHGPLGLARLFEDMARDWKGWSGAKEWSSLEGELTLRCTQDALGHVALQASLQQSAYPSAWKVEAVIAIEAGQLERLAKLARRFEDSDGP